MRSFNVYNKLVAVAVLCSAVVVLHAQTEVQNPDFPFWKIKGNTSIDTAQHFVGTTDANALTFRTNNIRRATIDVNGNVGIGTVLPQQRLHLFGNNTARIGGLATGGSFIATPAATTDKFLYADANGDIKALANGSNGQILTVNGSGIPAWTTPNDWTTTGNAGTVDGTHFIGTTDNISFNIRVNNQRAGRIAASGGNTFFGLLAGNAATSGSLTGFGYNALLNNTTGNENTAFGFNAMSANTTGIYNTAVGSNAMPSNTTGNDNTAMGRSAMAANTTGGQNTAVGKEALPSNTTGSNNSAYGYQAMLNNSTGASNVAYGNAALRENTTGIFNCGFGRNALRNNTTGNDNTAIGKDALFTNSTGTANTAVGKDAMLNSTTGNANIAMGYQALLTNTTGTDNIALGRDAMRSNSTGNQNTAIGKDAVRNNTTANYNVGVGYQALLTNTTGFNNTAVGTFSLAANSSGENNTALGINSLQNNTGSFNTATGSNSLRMNTTGSENVAAGKDALYTNTTGGSNTAYGYQALLFNTTSNDNTATGRDALRTNSTGAGNTATGRSALYANSIGNYNTAFGYQSLYASTAAENTAVGSNGLFSTTTGTQNTAIGGTAGFNNTTGSENTFLGYDANASTGNLSNATAVGANSTVSASNCLVLGNNANVGIGSAAPGQKLTVVDAGNSNQYSGTLSVFANNLTQGVGIGYMGIQALGSNTNQDLAFNARGAGHIVMQVTGTTGNVGIGISNPANLLSINGAADQFLINNPTNDGTVSIMLNENSANAAYIHHEGDYASGYLEIEDYSAGWASVGVVIKQSNVGIGTNNPTTAKLVVNGSQSTALTYGYLASSGGTGLASGTNPYSIYASDRIAATEFNAYSDARIKNVIGISNGAIDLRTLAQIQVTDYRLIDSISKGTATYKKVIAQQLEQVYPQAVTTITDVLPDIYCIAEIKNGYIAVANTLQKGDVVKLILGRGTELVPVISADAKGFTVGLKDEGRVFVYGRQVNDFRTVDYEAIAMLNVSATQELARKVELLEEQNAALMEQLKNLLLKGAKVER